MLIEIAVRAKREIGIDTPSRLALLSAFSGFSFLLEDWPIRKDKKYHVVGRSIQ